MKLKIMQIGYGYWGNNVARKLSNSDRFDLAFLIDTDPVKREKAKKDYPLVSVAENYLEHLNDVDAVAICTQTEFSFGIGMEAMNRGKHVFIEKPLARTIQQAQELCDTAVRTGVILHCDHLMVYNHVIRYIKRMIDDDELGDIMYIDISRVNLGPIRKDINAMLDLAVHDIAVVDYLLGGGEIDSISAYGTRFFGNQETITYLTMKKGDTLININSSWISPVKIRKTIVAGTKKMVIFDDVASDKLTIYDSGIDVVQGSVYGEYEFRTRVGDIYIPRLEFEDALLNSLEAFAEAVDSGHQSLSGPDPSLRVISILEKAQELLHG
ncbi:MAG: Gfo/Idh/MocA family oxidoreductase [Lachnospiraceae bacterium]|nr:Gfo/Idh/MocA family oxidoreductase [Lachnospiraceae bacterium]